MLQNRVCRRSGVADVAEALNSGVEDKRVTVENKNIIL